MNIEKIKSCNKKLVEEFEFRVQMKLPSDYYDFLIQNNGAIVTGAEFLVRQFNERIRMDKFYGIDTGTNTFNIEFAISELGDDIPNKSLIIGRDVGGGFILLVNNNIDNGIYYYDHTYFFEESTDELNTYYLCDSFSEFLASLINVD